MSEARRLPEVVCDVVAVGMFWIFANFGEDGPCSEKIGHNQLVGRGTNDESHKKSKGPRFHVENTALAIAPYIGGSTQRKTRMLRKPANRHS